MVESVEQLHDIRSNGRIFGIKIRCSLRRPRVTGASGTHDPRKINTWSRIGGYLNGPEKSQNTISEGTTVYRVALILLEAAP